MNKVDIFLLILICVLTTGIIYAADYYVSPNGSDDNSGTIGAPFQTIQHAVDEMASGDVCYLREGIYHEEIEITNLDESTFSNYQNESVILDGTIPIPSSWTVYDGNIYKTTLTVDIWQLFVNSDEMVMARWPNAGFVDGSVWNQEQNWAHGIDNNNENGIMVDAPHDGVNLANLGIDVTGAIGILNIGNFKTWTRFVISHGAGNNVFTYEPVPESSYRAENQYYFLEKKLEFLDQEREWFFDHDTKELYFWPPDNADPNNLNIHGKVQSYSFDILNSENIELKGLHFFATTVKMKNADHSKVENCNFLYPSCYKRMLGIVDTEPEMTLIDQSDYCTVSSCAFRYTDGSAIETHRGNNTIENCYFYHIDYTATDLSSVMTTIRMSGSNNVFRQNTVHRTGASSGINPGDLSIVEYNDMYDAGYLQSDGAIVHLMEPQQPGSETRYNWFHDSPKYGARFDGDGVADGDAGSLGTMHHNVTWNIKTGHMVKGHDHFVYNNTNIDDFDTETNGIVILLDLGGNEGTITRNNAANKIAGHREDSYQNYPVPGIYDHNWNGYETGSDVKDLLISPPAYENVEDYNPDQYDFRPNTSSALIDAGLHVEGITDGYVGSAPDLGAYESGGENWTPGCPLEVSSYQLPVVADAGDDIVMMSDEDGSATVTLNGYGTSDPSGGALTFSWALDGTVVSTDVSFDYNVNVGVHTFTLIVSNGILTASDEIVVTVLEFGANTALSFTGGNEDYVDCGNDAELQLGTHDLTVEFWLKTSASGVAQRIVGNGYSNNSDNGYSIWILSNGKLRAGLSDGTTSEARQNETILTDGNWHRCAVVYDRDDNLRVCVDGTCETKPIDTYSGLNCDNTNDTFVIGRRATADATHSYTGILDEVRIWNTALDNETVSAWQNQELTDSHPDISALQAYYKFSEFSGSTANDIAADYTTDDHASNGTIFGAEWAASDIFIFDGCAELGDINNDSNWNVLDIVILANCVLAQNCAEISNGCAGDLSGDGLWNVLDIVILANCVLALNCGGRVDDASEAALIKKDNQVSFEADGFIGGVQMTLTHGDDFSIEMTDRALLADYLTKGNETRLLVITPETDNLFSFNGEFEITELIVANSHAEISVDLPLATSFSLSEAYPNPFNPTTTMTLKMPVSGKMQVEVYNLMGQSVAILTSGYKDAGTYNLTWDATDVSSGMYFVKAEAVGFTQIRKLMLIK